MTDEDTTPDEPRDETPEGVLSPEDLVLDDDEHVRPLEDGRLVISTEEGEGSAEPEPTHAVPDRGGFDEPYAIELRVKTDHGIAERRVTGADISVVYGEALRWYAGRVDPGTPPEDVLRILRAAAGLE